MAPADEPAGRPQKEPLPAAPASRLAIVTCMDARMNVYEMFDLAKGDAHVIRNAGGVVTDDTIRSLTVSQHLLGTERIALVQHTRCGMLTFTDEEFADRLERHAGSRPGWRAQTFTDLEQSVRDGVARLREDPFLKHTERIDGFVWDVVEERLREVT